MDIDFARPYFGDEERKAVNGVMAGYWLANGEQVAAFEKEFAAYIGVPYALACNSGSSANLLALASLGLEKGAKVLTSGCGFPATLNPILHLGLDPILVDYETETCNISLVDVLQEIPNVKAVLLAHTMGNPVAMHSIMSAAYDYGVPVIEDCCEAIGARFNGFKVGAIGSMGTFSFYPSHQITALGGGGMVTFKNEQHYLRAKSLREWGKTPMRDTYGRRNTTYSGRIDNLDYFPHYIYETVGWNFQLPEANAAFGREQLKRMKWLIAERQKNHDAIVASLPDGEFEPVEVHKHADPCWFGVILKPKNVKRNEFGDALERRGIRHRPFFAGNITRHDPYVAYSTPLPNADWLMERALFIGCYAGMTDEQVSYVCDGIKLALEDCKQLIEA